MGDRKCLSSFEVLILLFFLILDNNLFFNLLMYIVYVFIKVFYIGLQIIYQIQRNRKVDRCYMLDKFILKTFGICSFGDGILMVQLIKIIYRIVRKIVKLFIMDRI